MTVIIGVDPHKASHTAVAISDSEHELGAQEGALRLPPGPSSCWRGRSRSRRGRGRSSPPADSAICWPSSSSPPARRVVDVPATLASRVRVLATGRSNKNDPNDALSVAVAALRSPGLRQVVAAGHSEVLRLLAKRNIDIGNHRTRVVCRTIPVPRA